EPTPQSMNNGELEWVDLGLKRSDEYRGGQAAIGRTVSQEAPSRFHVSKPSGTVTAVGCHYSLPTKFYKCKKY
ncbi:MAG: hypothetical protein ACSHX7_14235, partial [Luteolibacter sp.]